MTPGGYRLSKLALDDLEDIGAYIANDSPEIADRFVDRILMRVELLATNPHLGRSRPEFAPAYRTFPFANYVIVYRLSGDLILIERVLHGARSIPDILRDPP